MLKYTSWALGVLIIALLVYQYRQVTGPDPIEAPIIIRNDPDIYAQNVVFNQLAEDGSLHYRLSANNIRQFNDDQLTELIAPDLHLTNPQQPPWDITADRGYIRKRPRADGTPEDVVFLRDSVELIQMHDAQRPTTLRSEAFYIYPNSQYAQTDQNVMIDTVVGRTHAAGLAADLRTGLLKLSSSDSQKVHTIVLPEQFKNS